MARPESSDAELMATSLARPEAFGAVYDRHADTILRFLIRRIGLEVAEGVLGDTFRIAFEKRQVFDVGCESALPWLYGIASNLLMKHRRSETRRLRASAKLVAQAESARTTTRDTTRAVQARELWPRVAERIASLPAPEHDVLLLFAWEEMSYAEIASALEIPIGTVRSRLNRARERLRALDPELSQAEPTPREGSRRVRP